MGPRARPRARYPFCCRASITADKCTSLRPKADRPSSTRTHPCMYLLIKHPTRYIVYISCQLFHREGPQLQHIAGGRMRGAGGTGEHMPKRATGEALDSKTSMSSDECVKSCRPGSPPCLSVAARQPGITLSWGRYRNPRPPAHIRGLPCR